MSDLSVTQPTAQAAGPRPAASYKPGIAKLLASRERMLQVLLLNLRIGGNLSCAGRPEKIKYPRCISKLAGGRLFSGTGRNASCSGIYYSLTDLFEPPSQTVGGTSARGLIIVARRKQPRN